MIKSKLYRFSYTALIFLLFNCSKGEQNLEQIELGLWISLDNRDSLDFKTRNNFLRSNDNMVDDNYDYQEFNDSIRIGYRGKLFIGVEPTMHRYWVDNKRLTIDFTNQSCYGFNSEVITYMKR